MEGLPQNKTKIVCTIGLASESQQVIEQMLMAGMNVAPNLLKGTMWF